jgi:hypothetical protein
MTGLYKEPVKLLVHPQSYMGIKGKRVRAEKVDTTYL